MKGKITLSLLAACHRVELYRSAFPGLSFVTEKMSRNIPPPLNRIRLVMLCRPIGKGTCQPLQVCRALYQSA